MSWSKKLTLGILVCYHTKNSVPPFSESQFFCQLAQEAKKLSMKIIVFDPRDIDFEKNTIHAWYVNKEKKWNTSIFPLPKVVYDRCYYHNQSHFLEYQAVMNTLQNHSSIRFLGRALGGKVKTYDMLKTQEEVSRFLPLTLRYKNIDEAMEFLDSEEKILLKPNGGSHGKGIVAIIQKNDYYVIKGRSLQNKPFHYTIYKEDTLRAWVEKFIGNTRYIMQPFIRLLTKEQQPFDIRILVQKNDNHQWERTGTAVRIGKENSITSNLHGGGHAISFTDFLNENYPADLIPIIQDQVDKLSKIVPLVIEESHGPLLELGLDIGIDQQGGIWILEVNSKPGRSIFLHTKEKEIRRRSIQLPIKYAHSLLKSN